METTENKEFAIPKGKKVIFVGRFQPFHNGHLEAIKWILGQTDKVAIAIGSMQEYNTLRHPLEFKDRKAIVEAALKEAGIKNYKLFGLPDFYNDVAWTKKMLESAGIAADKAVLVSLNGWATTSAQNFGVQTAKHPVFCNDLSATQVRETIVAGFDWEELVPAAVAGYLKDGGLIQKIADSQALPEEKIVDFVKKQMETAGLKKVVLGVSGGIDSAVMAAILNRALKKKAIFVWMPFTKDCYFGKNVGRLARAFKMNIKKIYLDNVLRIFAKTLPSGGNFAYGNLKSRLRMIVLYFFANQKKALVAGTTNRTEMEIGYFTKYGDGGVDIEPIADLYKSEIYQMARRIKIPEEILKVAPTAALWPGQTDEKELGLTYFQLDTVLKLLAQGFLPAEVCRLADISDKKMQKIIDRKKKNAHKLLMPPILKLKDN
jgi:NAD+ synthase